LAAHFKFKDVDLEYFLFRYLDLIVLLRFLNIIIHQEDPKLLFQQELRGLVDKTTAQQSKVQQFDTADRNSELENFLLKFLDLNYSLNKI
jgi:hypothetical protein